MSVNREIALLERFGIGPIRDPRKYSGEMASDSLASLLQDMPTITSDGRFELGLDCLLDEIGDRLSDRVLGGEIGQELHDAVPRGKFCTPDSLVIRVKSSHT